MSGATQAQYAMPKRRLSDLIGPFTGVQKLFIENSSHLSCYAFRLFVSLRYFAETDEVTAMPSFNQIQKLTGMHRRNISQGFTDLIRDGWLKKEGIERKKSTYFLTIPERLSGSTGGPDPKLKLVPQVDQIKGQTGSTGGPVLVPQVDQISTPGMNKERACARAVPECKDMRDEEDHTHTLSSSALEPCRPEQGVCVDPGKGKYLRVEYLAYAYAHDHIYAPEIWADKAIATGKWDRLVERFQQGELHERPRQTENERRIRATFARYGGAPQQAGFSGSGITRGAIPGIPQRSRT